MKSAKCSCCGANITVDETKDAGICEYCNTPYATEKITKNYNNLNINNSTINMNYNNSEKTKFCKYCGQKILDHAIICVHCGSQVEELRRPAPQVQNNYVPQQQPSRQYYNVQNNYYNGKEPLDKWVTFILCFFLGCFGAHKFYEGKTAEGILYLCTMGLCGIGWLIDLFVILAKPTKYYP